MRGYGRHLEIGLGLPPHSNELCVLAERGRLDDVRRRDTLDGCQEPRPPFERRPDALAVSMLCHAGLPSRARHQRADGRLRALAQAVQAVEDDPPGVPLADAELAGYLIGVGGREVAELDCT